MLSPEILEPAYIQFKASGRGKFKFGCVACGIDCDFSDDDAEFTFQGHAEMDEVSGRGWAELDDNGILSGEISFHLGDESTFKASKMVSFSAADERLQFCLSVVGSTLI